MPQKDGGQIGDEHAGGGACKHRQQRLVFCAQCGGDELGFVAHLGKEEGNERGAECTEIARNFWRVEAIGLQHPQADGDERGGEQGL